jgi:CheY-like chemotaxis protein
VRKLKEDAMGNGRILIVEDDSDIVELLRYSLSGSGYTVETAGRGDSALEATGRKLPDLVVLDINLPGVDGYEELGADDYLTKPFDLVELELRIKNAIQAHRRMSLTDPRSGLPAARLIEDQVRLLMEREGWCYIEINVQHLLQFSEAYGFIAADEVLRYMALLLNQIADEWGTTDDFIGHAGGDTFVLITYAPDVEQMVAELKRRFDQEIAAHYNYQDYEQGGVRQADGSLAPMMSLSTGAVYERGRQYTDIREITESAAQAIRQSRFASI